MTALPVRMSRPAGKGTRSLGTDSGLPAVRCVTQLPKVVVTSDAANCLVRFFGWRQVYAFL
jgi:hypothetical protein